VARVKVNVEVMDIIGSELARQVFVSCSERGILLQKIMMMMTKVNKQALEWHQESLVEIKKKQETTAELNNTIKSLEKQIRDKDADLRKAAKSYDKLDEENKELEEKIKLANKNINALNTEYFSPRPIHDKRNFHHDVREAERALSPVKASEEEVRKNFVTGKAVMVQTSIDFQKQLHSDDSDEELDFGVKSLKADACVQVNEEELEDEDDLKRLSSHLNIRRPGYFTNMGNENNDEYFAPNYRFGGTNNSNNLRRGAGQVGSNGENIPQYLPNLSNLIDANGRQYYLTLNGLILPIPTNNGQYNTQQQQQQNFGLGPTGMVIPIQNNNAAQLYMLGPNGQIVMAPTGYVPNNNIFAQQQQYIIGPNGQIIPIKEGSPPSKDVLSVEVQTTRTMTLNKNPQTIISGAIFDNEHVDKLEEKIKSLQQQLSAQTTRSPSPERKNTYSRNNPSALDQHDTTSNNSSRNSNFNSSFGSHSHNSVTINVEGAKKTNHGSKSGADTKDTSSALVPPTTAKSTVSNKKGQKRTSPLSSRSSTRTNESVLTVTEQQAKPSKSREYKLRTLKVSLA
jgi:hypothetical protein